jgi:hypothetical protein
VSAQSIPRLEKSKNRNVLKNYNIAQNNEFVPTKKHMRIKFIHEYACMNVGAS